MGTFSVTAALANPQRPDQRVSLDLIVDTGATWTLLPAEVVEQLGLTAGREREVTLASGERARYRLGEVRLRLDGEELTTVFLSGPPGALALLGAVTLEQFGLAPDPIRQTLVPITGLLA